MLNRFLGLDVGTKRIGVATGDSQTNIAYPLETVDVDGREIERIASIANENDIRTIVVGYPRNQSGEATQQTQVAEALAESLSAKGYDCVYQDESVTSIAAENSLKQTKRPYEKADIDKLAASFILQDYLEEHRRA